MFVQDENQNVFRAYVADKPCRKFTKSTRNFMNATWTLFNRYAHRRGFTDPVQGAQYLGALAWRNPSTGLIMELCAE